MNVSPVWDEPVVRDPAGTVEVLMARGWDGHAAVAYAGQALFYNGQTLFYAVNVFIDRCKALKIRLPPLRPVKPPPMWAVTPERERRKR